jgi:hypothetical protein
MHTHTETLTKSIEESYEKQFWVQWAVDDPIKALKLSQGCLSLPDNAFSY